MTPRTGRAAARRVFSLDVAEYGAARSETAAAAEAFLALDASASPRTVSTAAARLARAARALPPLARWIKV